MKTQKDECLLVYDSCRAHLTEEVKSTVNKLTELAVIPGRLTKFLQPLDLTVNKTMKEKLRVKWDKWIMDEELAEFTKSGNRKKAPLSTICTWIVDSWKEIDHRIIKAGFQKARIISYPESAELELGIERI